VAAVAGRSLPAMSLIASALATRRGCCCDAASSDRLARLRAAITKALNDCRRNANACLGECSQNSSELSGLDCSNQL
jgi:hypothetical protein